MSTHQNESKTREFMIFIKTYAEFDPPPMSVILLPPQERTKKNKMKPTNPNAHTYVNGTDVKTHGYAVTHNTYLQ
jgi:hypothetical protein